jgi:DNA-binding transcriptional MerR regulator
VTEQTLYSISEVAAAFDVPVSTLRYYDDIGLAPATERRARVRYYDRRALHRLAYVQLWRLDGMLSIEQTAGILASADREQRNERLRRNQLELAMRIQRMQDAHEVLTHLMKCPHDDPLSCPVNVTLLSERIDAALDGRASQTAPPIDWTGLERGPTAPAIARMAQAVIAELAEKGVDHLAGDRPATRPGSAPVPGAG